MKFGMFYPVAVMIVAFGILILLLMRAPRENPGVPSGNWQISPIKLAISIYSRGTFLLHRKLASVLCFYLHFS